MNAIIVTFPCIPHWELILPSHFCLSVDSVLCPRPRSTFFFTLFCFVCPPVLLRTRLVCHIHLFPRRNVRRAAVAPYHVMDRQANERSEELALAKNEKKGLSSTLFPFPLLLSAILFF